MKTFNEIYTVVSIIWFTASILACIVIFLWRRYATKNKVNKNGGVVVKEMITKVHDDIEGRY